MTKQQQVKATKLIVLVRYYVKQAAVVNGVFYPAGAVVLKVRNGEGREYYVTLRRSKIHSCTCPHIPSAKCPECYHILETKRIENARARAARKVAQVPVVVAEVKDVLLLPERCSTLHQEIDTFLAHERARNGAQDIENRLVRMGFMRR